MADLRETLLANAKTALEASSVTANSEATTKPTGLNVYRARTRAYDLSLLPDCSVFYMGEADRDALDGATDETQRDVRLGVLCRAKATSSQTADAALLTVMQWAEVSLLLADYTVSGAAVDGRLERIDAIEAEEQADSVAEALLQFLFTVHTKWADPRQAP